MYFLCDDYLFYMLLLHPKSSLFPYTTLAHGVLPVPTKSMPSEVRCIASARVTQARCAAASDVLPPEPRVRYSLRPPGRTHMPDRDLAKISTTVLLTATLTLLIASPLAP